MEKQKSRTNNTSTMKQDTPTNLIRKAVRNLRDRKKLSSSLVFRCMPLPTDKVQRQRVVQSLEREFGYSTREQRANSGFIYALTKEEAENLLRNSKANLVCIEVYDKEKLLETTQQGFYQFVPCFQKDNPYRNGALVHNFVIQNNSRH
jgi:hypothetical protein